jgi:membrane-bound lytic murein transglycosylase B
MAQDDTTSAYAAPDPQDAAFQAYLQTVAAKARAQGIRESSIRSVMAGLTYNPRVVALDRAQPGGTPSSASSSPRRISRPIACRISMPR